MIQLSVTGWPLTSIMKVGARNNIVRVKNGNKGCTNIEHFLF